MPFLEPEIQAQTFQTHVQPLLCRLYVFVHFSDCLKQLRVVAEGAVQVDLQGGVCTNNSQGTSVVSGTSCGPV